MRIGRKLGVLVTVLLAFVTAFAGVILFQTSSQESAADRLRALVAVSAQAATVSQELQRERSAAASVLMGGAGPAQVDGFERQVRSTSAATDRYRRLRRGLSSVPAGTAALLGRIDGEIGGLPALREQIRSGKPVALSGVVFAYRILIADLISYRDSVAQAGAAPAGLGDRVRAGAALSRAAENVSLEQIAVLRAVAPGGRVTAAVEQDVAAARTGYAEAITSFSGLVAPDWQSWLNHELVGPDIVASQQLEDQVDRTPAGVGVQLDTGAWVTAMSGRADRLHTVEQRTDVSTRADTGRLYATRRTQTLGTAAGLLLAVLVAVGLAAAVGRPMTRRLRQLRDAAQWVAVQGLPQAVAGLRDAPPGTVDPAAYAAGQTGVGAVGGKDEIAEVGWAFNAVHLAAVRTAAEQVLLRTAAGQNLIHLSRRGQSLLDLLTRLLDTVERDETDPDRMEILYRLDNAVTRTRRVNLSLLLLGGAGTSVPRRPDASVLDVLRAALSQIEHYPRIEVGFDETGLAVAGPVVDEVVHLFAELLDNATIYSGPDAPVLVTIRAEVDGVAVEILDQGGLSADALAHLNERLAAPDGAHLASVQSIGLLAVAEVAAHHRIHVQLRGGRGGGTIAEVRLPHMVLRPVPARRPALSAPAPPRAAAPAWPLDPASVDLSTQELATVAPPAANAPPLLIFQNVAEALRFTPSFDAGHQAAQRAARPQHAATTDSGLPVRQPQDNLIPGSIQPEPQPARPVARRDPARVAASAAAYAAALARGRPHHRRSMSAAVPAPQGAPR